ncbi:unnamed protein product [Bursaphelenchus xylophilus]|uniref:(pine wood nematode) hypothetical protein n=1 Tax=Bursaphelenchus xylophilus TaxID=6326 RepID=A0A1I7SRZ9_BURXY|nr:unnamed protein product [Bursaphelenchus xylophilus]CAG9105868.1 unnamed protein product [Bursaphelenchus xylophilus]
MTELETVEENPSETTENYEIHADDNSQHDELEEVVQRRDRAQSVNDISKCQVLAYSIGHFYNDLCSSMWFTYLMIYLERVIRLDHSLAGLLMLIGQVTDAISTPIVGLLSDASILPGFLCKFGRRKSWHIIGTFCVTISFPFIFGGCLLCEKGTESWLKVLWFAPYIAMFQFGWAAVQISHLAMIPELSENPSRRTSMNSLRNAFGVIANLTVYIGMFTLLSNDTNSLEVNPGDLNYFREVGVGSVVLGLTITIVFYLFVKERSYQRMSSSTLSLQSDASSIIQMGWKNWFSHIEFYQVAFLYMFCRLYINVAQVYFPFYITSSRELPKDYLAILPLVSYLSSFVVSMIMGVPMINKLFNRKGLFMLAAIIGVANGAVVELTTDIYSIYIVSILLGIAQALLLISSLGVTAQLINRNTESGAFVYGAMSFMDKLSNGVVIQVIQLFAPACDEHSQESPACKMFYRRVMTYVPGSCVIIIFAILIFLNTKKLGERLKRRQSEEDLMDDHLVSTEEI